MMLQHDSLAIPDAAPHAASGTRHIWRPSDVPGATSDGRGI
ncbi:unnamed protein product [Mycetohabitans rhizoxinica HKI 454]|uniref:Uncharacterized protein n=1 Tax=Mycetohabitans rhizoxinica (strain DSM 19002 / CIP 109453 / HKI 454) TaxID=882378 RepID=E5ATB7_MYCRK|nr:unnamed protein product [Mycetohabitans rhizoxinica HKI 454]